MLDILQIKDYSILNDKVYNYWFIYISSLCEENNFDLSQNISIKYIEKYKFLDIHIFLS